MKVLCDRERLREALALASSVIPAKSTRPAIENVCLVATEDALEVIGTDLEVALRYMIRDVKVDKPGTALIPARVASDFVRDLTAETVTLECKGDNCFITGGTDSCELVTVDPDEYPSIDRFTDEDSLKLQAGNFTKLINRTSFAAAKEQGRYAMHGILTQVENQQLEMVATDGRRLAFSGTPIDAEASVKKRAIVPTKGLHLFNRVISDPLEQVKLVFSENRIGLKTENAEVFARLIDGEFPRYSAVIPEGGGAVIEADAAIFSKKLRLVANLTSQDTRAVRLSFEGNQMKIFGKSAGFGEASAQMEVDIKGDPGEVAYNPDYLLDGVKNCESDIVRLEYSTRTSPGKISLGENYLYIVMPITIDA